MAGWPEDEAALVALQDELAAAWRPGWRPPAGRLVTAACFVCFSGDAGFAAAAGAGSAVVTGLAPAPYRPGLLALREGALLERAVREFPSRPDALLVNASGRDHPRRAGLALHLGAVLELPTAGVTHRPLVATGDWPDDVRGAASPLVLDGEHVGLWLRTRPGTRPLAVHAGWQTDAEAAVALVLRTLGRARTPEPLREARRLARERRVAFRR